MTARCRKRQIKNNSAPLRFKIIHLLCVLGAFARKIFGSNFPILFELANVIFLIPGLAECYVERGIFRPPGDVDTRMGAKAPCNEIPETYTS